MTISLIINKIIMDNTHDIVILGSANSDHVFRLPSLPKEGETLQADQMFIVNGGKGANQAVAASRLQSKCCFAGQVGKDDNGALLIKEMAEAGLDLTHLRQLEGVPTGQAIIMLDKDANNSIVIVGGANMHYDDKSVLPDSYKKAIMSSAVLMLQKEVPMEINVLAAQLAKKEGKLVVADCGGRDDEMPPALLCCIDVLSPNKTELQRIIGTWADQEEMNTLIKTQLLDKYPQMKVLLKKGAEGCAFLEGDNCL